MMTETEVPVTRLLTLFVAFGLCVSLPSLAGAQPTDDGVPCAPCLDEMLPDDGDDGTEPAESHDEADRDDDSDELPDELTPWDVEPDP